MRFPNESTEYRAARDELLAAEAELRRHEEAVAAQRRTLPPGGEIMQDYEFEEWVDAKGDTRPVRMSELFGDKTTLLLYSFMFRGSERGELLEAPCPSCSAIIDAIDGAVPTLTTQVAFAVVTKPPVERIRAHASARGWEHARLLSSQHTTYNRDYGAEDEAGNQWPILTVFTKDGGTIRHFWSSELFDAPREEGQDARHVDFMWPLWLMLDRTPGGRREWSPSVPYDA
jgi:predicted dithiol-disulfide oxidoreductase (DUF899 family)